MNYNTKINIIQIKALKNSKIKTAHNQNILEKRINQAKNEIEKLRIFASFKIGRIANHCKFLANQIEKEL